MVHQHSHREIPRWRNPRAGRAGQVDVGAMVRKVIEYRTDSTGGMLCSHTRRDWPRHQVKRAGLRFEREALPALGEFPAESEFAARAERQAEDFAEVRLVAVPSDPGACLIFGDEQLFD